jgi:hypothetical protein
MLQKQSFPSDEDDGYSTISSLCLDGLWRSVTISRGHVISLMPGFTVHNFILGPGSHY